MTTFQERERAFEAKFAHDEEFRFLVLARRDKVFARWAAERLGVSGQDEASLIASVLAIRNGPGHDEAGGDGAALPGVGAGRHRAPERAAIDVGLVDVVVSVTNGMSPRNPCLMQFDGVPFFSSVRSFLATRV